MKNITKFLLSTLAIAVLFTSCDMSNQAATAAENKMNLESTRGIQTVDFMGSQMTIAKADIVKVVKAENAKQNEDAISGIMGNLMAAENEAMLLDVNFTMSDEPVEEGLFVFGIETEEEKNLTLEMYDEEGFEMAANNTIAVNQGNNYKALNVKSLENGTYLFKLKDEAGKELTRQVTVQHKD
jgi:hypothetical protein